MSDEPADGRHLLTVGQLADYAGVTTKAVRAASVGASSPAWTRLAELMK